LPELLRDVEAITRPLAEARGNHVVVRVLAMAGRSAVSVAPELSTLAMFVAAALLADGVQRALTGALRGLLDTRFLSIATFLCWWLFCLLDNTHLQAIPGESYISGVLLAHRLKDLALGPLHCG